MKGNLSTFPPIVWAFSLLCHHNILFWNSINVEFFPPPGTIKREELAKPARKDLWLTPKWVTIMCLGKVCCFQSKKFELKDRSRFLNTWHYLHLVLDDSLYCRGHPMHCRRLSGIPGLCSLDSSNNQRYLQTLPNIPWGAKSLHLHTHLSRELLV